jgi:hypothetical protein
VIKLKRGSLPVVLDAKPVYLADPNDKDRKLGIMLKHGIVKLML